MMLPIITKTTRHHLLFIGCENGIVVVLRELTVISLKKKKKKKELTKICTAQYPEFAYNESWGVEGRVQERYVWNKTGPKLSMTEVGWWMVSGSVYYYYYHYFAHYFNIPSEKFKNNVFVRSWLLPLLYHISRSPLKVWYVTKRN